MDNASGQLLGLYPLMDHDHAFSEDGDIPSQTSEFDETLLQAAMEALDHVEVDLRNVIKMEKPDELEDRQWEMVLRRISTLPNKNREI